jgi:hypothetical protein
LKTLIITGTVLVSHPLVMAGCVGSWSYSAVLLLACFLAVQVRLMALLELAAMAQFEEV